MLVSLSNKDFVGETLDLPPDERLEGTLAATAVSAWLGARVFRAHDVRRDPPGARHGRLDPRHPPAGRDPPRARLTLPAGDDRRWGRPVARPVSTAASASSTVRASSSVSSASRRTNPRFSRSASQAQSGS